MQQNNILYFLTHPLAISLLFSLIVIQFIPPIFNKYTITQTSKERTQKDIITYYHDLNNTGYSEKIEINKLVNDGITGVTVSTNKGIIDQWNIKGDFLNERSVFFGDVNNDGVNEIFVSTLRNNTIYLSCLNPFEEKFYFKEIIISEYFPKNERIDCSLDKCALYDMNNDSINEIYFSTSASYSKYPRRMFAYDLINDTLYKSPLGYTTFEEPFSFDIDNDGKPEFFGSPRAVGNSKIDDPFSDQFVWLIALDEKMNFMFEPKIIGYYPSQTSMVPFLSGVNEYLALLIPYCGNKEYKSLLTLYNADGQKVKEKIFDSKIACFSSYLFPNRNNYKSIFLLNEKGIIEEYNENLEVINTYNLHFSLSGIPKEFDLDNDGENEFIFSDNLNENLIITRNDFSNPAIVNITDIDNIQFFSLIENGNKQNRLFIYGSKYSYIFKYEANFLYYLKYVIYVGIFLGFLLIISIIQKTQKLQIEKKIKAEKKIAELQMKSIKNQIDTHFTLNILNSIGSLFAKQEVEKANYVFGKYSKLLRTTILGSDNILTTLQSEIEYVENYLAIEKFRMQDRFNYKIEIENGVNQKIKIPKTLIHTFVENAIKHGLRHLEKKGQLTISINSNNGSYNISVKDNGIGRRKAKEIAAFSTGKGLGILNQILELYYNLEKVQISYKIIDLFYNNDEPLGTKVLITIPIKDNNF